MVEDGAACEVKAFMAKVVVGVADEAESLERGNVKLMSSMVLPSPESTIK